jgi:hypothetical protein
MKQLFTCTLTSNKRNTAGVSPMVLLLNVVDSTGILYRDHCWVNLTPTLESLLPPFCSKLDTVIIATAYEYMSSEGIKHGLKGVKLYKGVSNGTRQ